MAYIIRSQWGARPPRARTLMRRPVSKVYVHHSATPLLVDGASACRQIQNQHMDVNGWSDIGYQELVHAHGDVYEGRGFDWQGGATRGQNSTSLAICALGNFDTMTPPAVMLRSIESRIVQAARDGRLTPGFQILGHRDANSTACPGKHLYHALPEIRANVARILAPSPEPDPDPMEDTVGYIRYNLDDATAAPQPAVWLIAPGTGERFAPPTDLLTAIVDAGGVKLTVTCGPAATRQFLDGHPG